MKVLMNMADRGLLPDRLIRFGIRHLNKKRLLDEGRGDVGEQRRAREGFIARMQLVSHYLL